mgnify:FL=1|jgi:hypothetical protein
MGSENQIEHADDDQQTDKKDNTDNPGENFDHSRPISVHPTMQ